MTDPTREVVAACTDPDQPTVGDWTKLRYRLHEGERKGAQALNGDECALCLQLVDSHLAAFSRAVFGGPTDDE